MDSTETHGSERKARWAYELSRLRRSLLVFSPMLVLVAIAGFLGHRFEPTLVFGASFFALGVAVLWYGRDISRAVLPGVAAGTVPLLLALCARNMGHVCTGSSCLALCLPACAVGGLIAGGAVAAVGIRGWHGAGFWLAASGITLLTGAMGCVCVGATGIVGLVAGYVVGGGFGTIVAGPKKQT